ncbi:MAG: DUF1292 domain-containing protein [Bacilli bacterium]|mgnify:CR=1 FL=1|jgi:uncharacterized protein YrzB (UPF0473 family)
MTNHLDENEVVLKDDDGNEYLLKILFTYHNPERNTDYVFAYDSSDPDTVYIMKYGENDEVIEVTDSDELEEAQEVFDAYNEDPKIQGIK